MCVSYLRCWTSTTSTNIQVKETQSVWYPQQEMLNHHYCFLQSYFNAFHREHLSHRGGKETERQTDRERLITRERQKEREREGERDRQRERQRERETDREKDRGRETEREILHSEHF